jgi:hypothetical protein
VVFPFQRVLLQGDKMDMPKMMASLKVSIPKSRLNVQILCLPDLAAKKIVHGVDNVQNSTKNLRNRSPHYLN